MGGKEVRVQRSEVRKQPRERGWLDGGWICCSNGWGGVGGVLGFIGGAIVAIIYNIVLGATGGVEMDLDVKA